MVDQKTSDSVLGMVSVASLLEGLLNRVEANGGTFTRDSGHFFGLLRVAQDVYGPEAVRPYEKRFDDLIEAKRRREASEEQAAKKMDAGQGEMYTAVPVLGT